LIHQFPHAVVVVVESLTLSLMHTPQAAVLVEAVESLRLGDPDAEASVQALVDSGDVSSAVEECIEASLCALSDSQRNEVLRAAAYAKCFVGISADHKIFPGSPRVGVRGGSGHFNKEELLGVQRRAALSERFVMACRVLKSRALLDASNAMCITGVQLWTRTPAVIIASLLQTAHFGVAAKMCDLFGISHKVVAVQWVRKKVSLCRYVYVYVCGQCRPGGQEKYD
jgi:hypothetical protein